MGETPQDGASISRLLVVELNDEGVLSIPESSDEFAAWEICGIAAWLNRMGEDSLVAEDDG